MGQSRPSRARGLKLAAPVATGAIRKVAPFTGAWIETPVALISLPNGFVAPFTGAWIETRPCRWRRHRDRVAPFTGAWIETPRNSGWLLALAASRPSRARGLKRSPRSAPRCPCRVAPFTGAWIETPTRSGSPATQDVAPFTGAWIETPEAGTCRQRCGRRALHGRVD